MGQYYKPCILQEDRKTIINWVYSHDYGSGLKLMEHSWFKNDFVGAIEKQLIPGGRFYKKNIVWAGDYADNEKTFNLLTGEEEEKENLYGLTEDWLKIMPPAGVLPLKEYKYIVNHSKKEFINKTKVPNVDGWRIHPLSLMTCEGNGRGGGDFRGESELVGAWARDMISVEKYKPKDYKEIIFDLVE